MERIIKVFGETLFFFGLIIWLYGVAIQITHPEFLTTTLSHLITWIRVDTATILGFIMAIIGFIIMRYVQVSENPRRKEMIF
jgi:predicted membrane protein